MCWRCDNPWATFADYLDEVVRPVVARVGHAVQATEMHGVPLAYTVGLTRQGRAELVVTGKSPPDAYDLLQAVLAGEEEPTDGCRCDLLHGPALWAFRVLRPRALSVAAALHPDLSALQLVWADSRGDWPWQRRHPGGQALLCDVRHVRAA